MKRETHTPPCEFPNVLFGRVRKLVLLVSCLLIMGQVAIAQVTVLNTHALADAINTTTLSVPVTISAGTNRLLVVPVGIHLLNLNTGLDITSVEFDDGINPPQLLTQSGISPGSGFFFFQVAALYHLPIGTGGATSGTVIITSAVTADQIISAPLVLENVDGSNPVGNIFSLNFQSGTAGFLNNSVNTSASGSYIIDVLSVNQLSGTPNYISSGAGQSVFYGCGGTGNCTDNIAVSSGKVGGNNNSTVTMSHQSFIAAGAGTGQYVHLIVEFLEGVPIIVNVTETNVTCNGASDGTATASASGGMGPYSYAWSTGGNTAMISGLAPGTYTVTATDANGATGTGSIMITEPDPLTVAVTGTDEGCGAMNGTATAAPAGGSEPYTYFWNNGGGTSTITGLVAGTYSVTITDVNMCTATGSVTIGNSANLSVTATGTNVTCNGETDGIATASVASGSGNYSYVWSNMGMTATISGLPANTYSVTVTDVDNACTGTASVTITEPTVLTASVSPSHTTCGLNNGTATATPMGGTPPYSYLWNTGATTAVVSNLPAGTYTVDIADVNGCTTAGAVTINGSIGLSLSFSHNDVSCNGENDGAASVTASNGSNDYSYNWITGSVTQNTTNLFAGTYTVTVTDNVTTCTTVGSVTISQPTALVVAMSSTNTSCGLSNGTATATPSGGTPGYSYLWNNGANTPMITNLASGTYTVVVTDVNGCTQEESVDVIGSVGISLSTNQTNVTCPSGNDGSATVNVLGGSGNYSYLWSTTETTQMISTLVAGMYSIEVTDMTTGCTATADVTITEPPALTASVMITNTSCGFDNGAATAVIGGGTPGYTYLWNTGATTVTISNLAPGMYTVTATDVNGCSIVAFDDVIASSDLGVTIAEMNVSCNGANDGSATANVVGGSGNYTYLWNTGATTATISGLTPGMYSVDVTDNTFGCTGTADVTITEPPILTVIVSGSNTSCGLNNGTATATPMGGTPPYSYLWNNGSILMALTDLAPGDYSVVVTDANNCTATDMITVASSTGITLSVSLTNVSCNGGSDGEATVTVNGGSGNYSYLWSTGGTAATEAGLTAGMYTVDVTDMVTGCAAMANVTITEPPVLSVSATATATTCGLANGTATATPAGGTPGYTYLWDNGETTAMISNLAAGDYTVGIADLNGCTAETTVTVDASIGLTVVINQTNVSCNGLSDGSATATVSNGSGDYTYAWSSGGSMATESGLAAGTYTLDVTDNVSGCTASETVVITEPLLLTVAISSTNTTCGQDNGTATATPAGGTPGYTYLWNNGATVAMISGLAAGTYSVVVTDANGCTATNSVVINGSANLGLSISLMNVSCNGGNDGSATVTVGGGSGNYSYVWSSGGTMATETGLSMGTYTVDVTDDDSGCTGTTNVTITEPPVLTSSISPTHTTCGQSNGAATALPLGGTPGYTYLWNTGATGVSISNIPAGDYDVVVTDANGCTSTAMITIQGSIALQLSTSQTNVSCNGANDGMVSAFPSGGSGNYSYLWNTGATTATISSLAPGSYTVDVTDDDTGCTASEMVTITEPPVLTVSITSTNTICGGNNGTATATAMGGTTNYSYAWDNSANTADLVNLSPGDYVVTVTDNNGCTATAMVTIAGSSSSPTVLTAASAAFSDGSGPDDYINSINCQWLIQPTNGGMITLNFTAFDTEPTLDFVRIHDGSSISDPVLAEYSGNMLPPSVTSTGSSMLVVFVTNTSIVAAGWDAFYTTSVNCPTDLAIPDEPIMPGTYQASNSISSTGRVGIGTHVIFDATNEILLDLDFEVEVGAEFDAITGVGCTPFAAPPSDEAMGNETGNTKKGESVKMKEE